jgi:hypothetical protein
MPVYIYFGRFSHGRSHNKEYLKKSNVHIELIYVVWREDINFFIMALEQLMLVHKVEHKKLLKLRRKIPYM